MNPLLNQERLFRPIGPWKQELPAPGEAALTGGTPKGGGWGVALPVKLGL